MLIKKIWSQSLPYVCLKSGVNLNFFRHKLSVLPITGFSPPRLPYISNNHSDLKTLSSSYVTSSSFLKSPSYKQPPEWARFVVWEFKWRSYWPLVNRAQAYSMVALLKTPPWHVLDDKKEPKSGTIITNIKIGCP